MHKRCSTVDADPCRAPHNVIRLKIYRIAVSKNAQSRDAIAFQNKQIQPLQSLHLPGNVVQSVYLIAHFTQWGELYAYMMVGRVRAPHLVLTSLVIKLYAGQACRTGGNRLINCLTFRAKICSIYTPVESDGSKSVSELSIVCTLVCLVSSLGTADGSMSSLMDSSPATGK